MFSKSKDTPAEAKIIKAAPKASNKAIPSIIGSDVTIVGNVSSQGVIQLDGTINGEINIRHLTVGNHGWIDGAITAEEVIIKGKVTGTIKAHKIVLEKNAKVHGDIQHEIISIEAGAEIEGHINQISKTVTELSSPLLEKQKKES
ncbi:MAG: polymer-forming cytoskeletal protein [Colwellia sp.]